MIEFSNEELNMILSALSSKTRACGYLGLHMTPEVMEKYNSLQSKIQKYLWEQIRSGYKRLRTRIDKQQSKNYLSGGKLNA